MKTNVSKLNNIYNNDFVAIVGKINSKNITTKTCRHTVVFGYAETIVKVNPNINENTFSATGKLCNIRPLCRVKNNRLILECILSVLRKDNKCDFIPLVLWGDTAVTVNNFTVDTTVSITGRFQSRKYKTESGFEKIIHEVSIKNIRKIDIL